MPNFFTAYRYVGFASLTSVFCHASALPWCRPIVTEAALSHLGGTDASLAEGSKAEMMIRQGRYPIQVSELASLVVGDGSSTLVPNDTFANEEKSFTVITGINGGMLD